MKYLSIIPLLVLCSFISYAQTLPPPFTACPSTGFQVVNSPTNFQTVNLATGTTTTVATFTIYVNAIGFNPNDGRIYGIRQSTLGLVAIGSDYTYNIVPTTGAALQGSVVGDVSPSGYLWCQGSTNIYKIDCNPGDGANFGKVTLVGTKSSSSFTDWSFPTNDTTKIYTVNSSGALIYISTADLSVHTVLAAAVPAASYGATYFDSNGNFYAKSNTTGVIYKFINATTASPTVVTFSTSTTSGQNDGARCANAAAPVIADYGDAPDSYGTYTASGGPVHLLSSPNPALAQVYLGDSVSIDADGQPSAAANLDYDDGISSFTPIAGGNLTSSIPSYSVVVKVHNATASAVNLAGWIDWDNNGTFDAGERISVTVPASFTGNETLTWNSISLSGTQGTTGTYGRFRISTDALPLPGGTASDGEVEDYYIPFTAALPVSLTSFTAERTSTSVKLAWVTSSEQNNKGFSIERSANGINFSKLDFVPSQAPSGTSGQTLNYNYYDTRPMDGINYYRLQQTDIDGHSTYSAIIKAVFGVDGNIVVAPNPATNTITVYGLKGNENIKLYSDAGLLIKNERATNTEHQVDISTLQTGIYQLVITDATGNKVVKKIIKVR